MEVDHPKRSFLLYCAVCALFGVDAWQLLRTIAAAKGFDAVAMDAACIALAILALIALGWRTRHTGWRNASAFAAGALVGAAFFFRSWGCFLLVPTHVDWLLNGDWAQHYSGWEMFRAGPWKWPPGVTPGLMYPLGTSVVYTDSLPLFALLLKPFAALLPSQFQYIGLWFLLSCTLQGGIGALLICRRTRDPAQIFAGALLFLYAPVFIARFGHDTLTAHWLVLAAILLYFRQISSQPWREVLPWLGLVATAALVHPYLACMVVVVQASGWMRRVNVDHALDWRKALLYFGASMGVLSLMWWLSGAFIIPRDSGAGGVPFGVYSMNLLAPFDPQEYSRLLPALPTGTGQHEGFAFAGLGIYLLALIAVPLLVTASTWRNIWHRHWPILAVAFGCVIFAISTVVQIGNIVVFDRPIESSLLGVFRSSGRFVWVAYYLAIAGVIWLIVTRLRPMLVTLLLIAALALQMWDVFPAHVWPGRTSGPGSRARARRRRREHASSTPPGTNWLRTDGT